MYVKMVKVVLAALVLSLCKSLIQLNSRLGPSGDFLSEATGLGLLMQLFVTSTGGFIVGFW